ncbi:hypothetical protein DVS77_01170 [Mycolicibacterium moriokaense]|nr:hypothetical protein DVS77_01170 [Mycolicibacterium moriokaense]
MQRLSCELCRNPVLVERYTEQQMSVQWLADSETVCQEFIRRKSRGESGALIPTCSALRSTIAVKIRAGAIGITERRQSP